MVVHDPADSRVNPVLNRTGRTVGWLEGDVLYDRGGRARAVLRAVTVYSDQGTYLGRFDSYLTDRAGRPVAFVPGADFGHAAPPGDIPVVPATIGLALPVPGIELPEPAVLSAVWSDLDWEGYLDEEE